MVQAIRMIFAVLTRFLARMRCLHEKVEKLIVNDLLKIGDLLFLMKSRISQCMQAFLVKISDGMSFGSGKLWSGLYCDV